MICATSIILGGCSKPADPPMGVETSGEETQVSVSSETHIELIQQGEKTEENTESTLESGQTRESSFEQTETVLTETEPVVTYGVNREDFTEQTDSISESDAPYEVPSETVIDPSTVQTEAPSVISSEMGAEITESYAYETLTDREKALYNVIYTAALNLQEVVDVTGYTEEDWVKCFGNVYYQCPELFWVDSYLEFGRIYYRTTNVDEINAMQAEIQGKCDEILSTLKGLSTNVERIKYIHDYLVLNCDFEKEKGYNQTIYGMITQKLQCEGYAKLFTYICQKAGIPSAVITGNVDSGASHAWNIVNIDGIWYNIDITHDDPILSVPNNKYVRYNYFLVPDAWINNISHFRANLSQTYHNIKYFDVPACTNSALNYFNYYDKVFTSYDEAYNMLLARTEEAMRNQQPLVQIKVSNAEIYSQVLNNLVSLKKTAESETGIKPISVAKTCDDSQYIIGISIIY